MKFLFALSLSIQLLCTLAQKALYEPDRGIYFGAWYDRLNGDTPVAIDQRLRHNCSIFHSDINVTATEMQTDAFDQMVSQIADTQTDAIFYLTLFSFVRASEIPDSMYELLGDKLKVVTDTGRRVFLRPYSEMNGNWFAYGQQPTTFVGIWRRMVNIIRAKTDKVAFVWAPNAANGYPYGSGRYFPEVGSPDWNMMDVNEDGVIDVQDDPYSIFYPGDEYVDWVGFTVYHYGTQWPWETNDIPAPGKVEAIITGHWGDSGPFNFYEMFCGEGVEGVTAGGKPFLISETSGTVHLMKDGVPIDPGPGQLAIKQAWWRQLFNETLLTNFPKIHMISLFEFLKFEETTWRDFRILQEPHGLLDAFRTDIEDLGDLVIWANYTAGGGGGGSNGNGNGGNGNGDGLTSGALRSINAYYSMFLAMIFATLFWLY